MLKKIKQMPAFIAIIIMVVCMLAGITFGNKNALDSAAANAETAFHEVVGLSVQRAQKAGNLLVLCNRNIAGTTEAEALAGAIEAVEDAVRPSQVAEANRRLTFAANAASPLVKEAASAQDQKLLTGVLDDMGSLEKQLTRKASVYNETLVTTQDVYNKLPMRFLIGGMPEVYR